jgi:hypothetical protein
MGLGAAVSATPAIAQSPSPEELARQTLERRAVTAAIWGMPIVSVNAMRQAFFRDAKANYNDVVFLTTPSDWEFQTTTPNITTHYVYFNFNTKEGPVVVEIPPAIEAGLFGSFLDAWQVPLTDVGPAGEDQGKGGKYLLLPRISAATRPRATPSCVPRLITATRFCVPSRKVHPKPT